MSNITIRAKCTTLEAQALEAKGAVRALVNARPAIVSAHAWNPINGTTEGLSGNNLFDFA